MRPNCEALSAQLSPELGAVMTALMPAHFQIIPMGVNQRGAATLLAFRKALGADKAAYGLTAQAALTRDFPLRNALPEQCHHRLITGHPPLATVLDQTPMARDGLGRRRFHERLCSRLGFFRRDVRTLGEQSMMRRQSFDQCFAQVAKQMPTVGHLYGLWCS